MVGKDISLPVCGRTDLGMSERLSLNNEILSDVSEHAASTYPEECCGFLYGVRLTDSVEIKNARPVENMKEENRTRRFLISPEEYMRAEKYADEIGMDLMGVYHSHPDHPAVPSDYDREMALPGFVYLIVSVQKGTFTDSRWWQISPDRSEFLEIDTLKLPRS